MLKAVITNNDRTCHVDFTKPYDSLFNAIKRISNSINFMDAKVNDFDIHFTKDSGGLYKSIRELITPDDRLFYIYKACRIVEQSNDDVLKELETRINDGRITTLVGIDIFQQVHGVKESLSKNPHSLSRPNCNELQYEQIKLFDRDVLFTPWRVDKSTLPKGMHLYEVQHDDEQKGTICAIADSIRVNFWGTIISNQPIHLEKQRIREIDEDTDIEYSQKGSIKLDLYMQLHPMKNKDKTR
jgi:hypothetical protein